MPERTFSWWRFKLGFQGDEEFVQLALIAPDRVTYLAAIGELVVAYDAAHRKDQRTPALPSKDRYLLDLLVEAGLLGRDYGVPEATWEKYRVRDQKVEAGVARAASAQRSAEGRFLPAGGPAEHDQRTPAEPAYTETETETERENDRTSVNTQNEQKSVRRSNHAPARARGVEKLSDTAAYKNLKRSVRP